MRATLDKCPFCGGEAALCKNRKFDGQTSYETMHVECSSCGCRTRGYITDGYYGINSTYAAPIKAWNKRISGRSDDDLS